MGTSLAVQPFAGLASRVGNDCPRLLINREKVGEVMWYSFVDAHKCNGSNFRQIPLWPCWDLALVLISMKKLVTGLAIAYFINILYIIFLWRDVFYQSDCDDGCLKLAELLGWNVGRNNLYPLFRNMYSRMNWRSCMKKNTKGWMKKKQRDRRILLNQQTLIVLLYRIFDIFNSFFT